MIEIRCIRNRWVGKCSCFSQGKTLFSGLSFKNASDIWYFPHPYTVTRRGSGLNAEYTISASTGIRRFKLSETGLTQAELNAMLGECRCQCENDTLSLRMTISELTETIQIPWEIQNTLNVFVQVNGVGQIMGVNYTIDSNNLITFTYQLEENDEIWIRELRSY